MVNPIGFRFCPNDEEIVDHYLRLKNLGGDTSYVDGVISTVNICTFDPWDLPSQAMIKSKDQVWYFFSVKENKYNRGDRQSRKTSSGFWKKTGVTMNITRKRGNREKIGEKRVLVFHFSKNQGGSKSDWVMHEYLSTLSSPINQTVTYTICKVEFKGEETEISSSAGSDIVDHSDSLIPLVNNSQGLTAETEEEAQVDDALSLDEEWKTYLVDDEQMNILCMQEDRNDYRPQKPLTGVFSDDSDSNLISATTNSIQTSSTCDSFGSSNHLVDQITDLQEFSNSTIKLVSLTQEVSKALGTSNDTSEKKNHNDDAQGTEIGEHKLGQETVKNKRAGFFCRIIQKFFKKIHLCSSISRTRYQ